MRKQLGRTWHILKRSVSIWSDSNAAQAAGALAFYTLFSMAPLLIVVIAIAGAFFGEDAAQGRIEGQIEALVGPRAAATVEEAVERSRVARAGLLPTVLGVAAMLLGATTVFAQMQTSLNTIWNVKSKPSRTGVAAFLFTRLVSFGMVLGIGFVMLTSFLITIALAAVIQFAEHWIPVPTVLLSSVDVIVSLGVVTVLFMLIFRVLPDVHLSWKQTRRGALLTAVLFVLGQYVISVYLTRAGPASAYGAAGALVVILLWVFYSAQISLFGASVTRALVEHDGDSITPSRGAVEVRTEVVEADSAAGASGKDQ
ncbi:MAG: YihY/virulence factor BrkB family protein [Gemmatimonadales bacterium]